MVRHVPRGVWLTALVACGQPGSSGSTGPHADDAPACIVATERGPRGGQLVLIGGDGARRGDLTRATVVAVRDNSARVSPDGQWLVFASSRARNSLAETSLWLLRTRAGEQPRRLTSGTSIDIHPVWTPDGKAIVYSSQAAPGESFGLWRVPLMAAKGRPPMQSGPPERISHDPSATAMHPTVSPDGTRVVFMRLTSDKQSALWQLDLSPELGAPTPLTRGPVDLTPTFSPDGKHIAFASRDKGLTTHLYVMNADGTGRRVVVEEPLAAQTGPRYSPDGRYLFGTSVFRSLTTGKALYSAIVFVDLRESTHVLRSLHDVVGREVNRLGPTVLPCSLDATVMHRNGLFLDNLRDAFAEEVRRRVDKMREATGGELTAPATTP